MSGRVKPLHQRRSWVWQHGVRVTHLGERSLAYLTFRWGKPRPPFLLVPSYSPDGVTPFGYLEEVAAMLLRKEGQPKAADVNGVPLVDPAFTKKFPTLWAYLTQTAWDDGTARLPSGLTVFVQDGLFKGLLKENNEQLCLWVAAPGFFPLLDALEMALNVPQPDWRHDRRVGGGVAKKKPK